ncbi:MAG: hypothetical protein ABIR33_01815 [Pyrinomonadaceae bacterium]
MRTHVKIYSASCLIVLGFFVLLQLPWGLLPFSDGANIALVGAVLVTASAGYIFYLYRREGFEFGWFLANRGGFWILTLSALGIVMIVCGGVIYAAPQYFAPAFEQGALPFGIAIVSLFWLALIYMFGYLSIGMVARIVASVRLLKLIEAGVYSLIALVCLGMAGVFFSLFLEVLNDILVRIVVPTQWTAIWIFVTIVVAAGIAYGVWKEPSYHFDDDNSSKQEES